MVITGHDEVGEQFNDAIILGEAYVYRAKKTETARRINIRPVE
jgi:hypothetical protein